MRCQSPRNVASGVLQDGIDAAEGVEGAGEADVRQHLGQRVNQCLFAVAYVGVPLHMRLNLRLTPAQGADNGKGQQFPRWQIKPRTGIDVAKAEGLTVMDQNVLLPLGSCGVHRVNGFAKN